MSWADPINEPTLPLVEQIPMGFTEGYGVFSAKYSPIVIVADATGVRHGDGSYVEGSKRRVAWHEDEPSSTSQHVLVPDPRDNNVVYFATCPEKQAAGWGGYQDYHIVRIDLKADTVTEPFVTMLPVNSESWYSANGIYSTEAIAAASFPALDRVWIVMLFNQFNDPRRWDDDTLQIHAYRITDGKLYPPVITKIQGGTSGPTKFTFGPNGRVAYFKNMVLEFSAETGEFAIAKLLKESNQIYNGAFSPSGRYLWVPRFTWDQSLAQAHVSEVLQYDLHQTQDSLSPIFRRVVEPWSSFVTGLPYLHCALGPDCRLYFSYGDFIGCIENPDLEGEAAGVNPTWKAVPSTFRGRQTALGYVGLPDLVNQLTFPEGQRSCLWPRVEITSDTVCEGGCAELTATFYNSVDTWEWTFEGGVPSTWTGKSAPCIRYDRSGAYTAQLIVTNNAGRDTITSTILVRPSPRVSAGNDVQMCRGGSAVLTASGALQYRWQPSTGLSDSTSASPTLSPLRDSMMYVVVGTDAFGCVGTDTVVVRQGTLQAGVSSDTSVCNGSSVLLTASGGDAFTWWPSNGLSSVSSASVVATPAATTRYFVEVRSGTCIDTASVVVRVVNAPSIQLSGDTIICAGNVSRLVATSDMPGLIVWTDQAGATIDTAMSIVVRPSARTTYTAVVTSTAGCRDTQSIVVNIEQAATHDDVDTAVCAGTVVVIGSVRVVVQRDTTWQVISSTPSGCADTSRVTVRSESIDVVAEGVRVCYGELATCKAYASVRGTSDMPVIHWFDEFGTLVHTGATYTVRADANKRLRVRALSPLGCEAVATADISIVPPKEWTTTIGKGSGVPGSSVHTTLTSGIAQQSYRLTIAPTAPEAIITAVTPGRILSNGRDGRSIVIEVDAADADLTWQVFLGARQQIPLEGSVTLDDSSCVSADVVAGTLDIEGCAILMRTIRITQGARVQVYSLLGTLIADVAPDSAEATVASLQPGLYIVRSYGPTAHEDQLLLVE
jgi:PKD repeat protein